ncbi:hypothetical protein LFM09_47180 [Lentzea alba]|uniref:WXG100-like domain-containing protein n=1 Tax=Lentzea alba TaxID=2714351 RepID=UPI0039BF2875
MSVTVPPELDWFFIVVAGNNWPKGDEDGIRAIAAALDDTADEIDGVVLGLVESLREVTNHVDETVGRAFLRYGRDLADQPALHARSAREMADVARNYALNVEAAKYSILVQIAFTAFEVTRMLIDPFEWPLIGPFLTMMQEVVQGMMARFVAGVRRLLGIAVTKEAAPGLLTSTLGMIAQKAVQEGAEEVGQDAIVQAVQFAEQNRQSWDELSSAYSFAFGAAAGAFAGALARGLNVWRPQWKENWAQAAFVESVTEGIVGALTIPLGGAPGDIWKGMLNGAISGAGVQALRNRRTAIDNTKSLHLRAIAPPETHLAVSGPLTVPQLSSVDDGSRLRADDLDGAVSPAGDGNEALPGERSALPNPAGGAARHAPHGVGHGVGSVAFDRPGVLADLSTAVRHELATRPQSMHATALLSSRLLDLFGLREPAGGLGTTAFNDVAVTVALATGPDRGEDAVLAELLSRGVLLRVAVDTAAGPVEQNAVLTASLAPGEFRESLGGADHFGHDMRVGITVESDEWRSDVVVSDAVRSVVFQADTFSDEQFVGVSLDRVSGSVRREWELGGLPGLRPESIVETRLFAAHALHNTILRAVPRDDLAAVTTATTGQALSENLPQALSAQGHRIEVDGSALVLKADLHERELLDIVGDRYLVRAVPSWEVTPPGSHPLLSGHDGAVVFEVDRQGLTDLGLNPNRTISRNPSGLTTNPEDDEQPHPNPGLPLAARLAMPDYLAQSLGLGESVQHSHVEGVDIRAVVGELLPTPPAVLVRHHAPRPQRQPVHGIDRVERDLRNSVATLVGDVRRYPIRQGGKDYELIVHTELDWNASDQLPGKTGRTFVPKTKTRRFATTHTGTASTPAVAVPITVAAVAPMIATLTPSFTTNVNEIRDQDVQHEFKRAASAVDTETGRTCICVSYAVELVDADERVVGKLGHGQDKRLTGTFIAGHPTRDRANNGTGLKPLFSAPPVAFALEDVILGQASLFDQAVAMLPEYLTKIGSPGRQVLAEFLHRSNIAAQLPGMVVHDPGQHPESGWRRSAPLTTGALSSPLDLIRYGNAVEMRLVARQVEVLDEFADMEFNDWSSGKAGRTGSRTGRRKAGISGAVAAVQHAGVLMFSLGPGFDMSHERSRTAALKREIGSRYNQEYKGRLVRYRTVHELQIRTLGRPARTLEGDVIAYQWTTWDRALAAGIVAPAAEDDRPSSYRSGGDRTHFGPAHLESGLSLTGAKVEALCTHDRVYAAIADTLRRVPGHRWYHFSSSAFIKDFDDPALAVGLKAAVNDIIKRQESVKHRLSDEQFTQLVDQLVGPGLVITLVKQGFFHDNVVTIRLKATLQGLADGDLQVGAAQSASESRVKQRDTRTLTTTRATTVGGTVQGRVTLFLRRAAEALASTVRLGRTWTQMSAVGAEAGEVVLHKHGTRVTGATVAELRLRHFKGDLRITPTVTAYRRASNEVRSVTFGRRGRHVPARMQVPVDPLTVPVEFLVPDHLVTGVRPEKIEVTPVARRPLPDGTSARDLRPGAAVLDGTNVLSIAGTEHIVRSASEMLALASGDDAFAMSEGLNAELVTERFSPDHLRKEPRLFGRHVVEGLVYSRRRADVYGQVVVVLSPVAPQRLSSEEYQWLKRTAIGSTWADWSRDISTVVDKDLSSTFTPRGAISSHNEQADGASFGVVGATVSLWSVRRGRKRARKMQGTEKTYFMSEVKKQVLVRIGVRVEVVAETQVRGNLDRLELTTPSPVHTAGEQFVLPDSVLVWMTEEQLAELQGQKAVVAPPTVPARTLPAPESLSSDVSSLGIGAVDGVIDISDVLPELREQLGDELADALLPPSTLLGVHDNARIAEEQLRGVDKVFGIAVNGGISTPIRVERRFSGETYVLSIDVEWASPPGEGSVELVRRLAARTIFSSVDTKESLRATSAGTLTVNARTHGRIRDIDPGEDDKIRAGTVGGGLQVQYTPVSHSNTATRTATTERTMYAEVRSGPVGVYQGDARLIVRIDRKLGFDPETMTETVGQPVARIETVRRVRVRKLAEETLLPADVDGRLGQESPIELFPKFHDDWRSGGFSLPQPGEYEVEHFLGRVTTLRRAVLAALAESGAEIDTAAVLAVRAAVTGTTVKAGLPSMTEGDFAVPLPPSLGRDLVVHARLKPKPMLASASNRVEMDSNAITTERGGVTSASGKVFRSTLVAPVLSAGENPPNADPGTALAATQNFQSVHTTTSQDTPLVDTRLDQRLRTQADLYSSSDRTPKAGFRITKPQSMTRGLLAGVEFRVVARTTDGSRIGVAGLTVDRAYLVRVRDAVAAKFAGKLPEGLVNAVDSFASASKKWADEAAALATARVDGKPDDDLVIALADAETTWWTTWQQYLNDLRAAQRLERISALELAIVQESPEVTGVVRPMPPPRYVADLVDDGLRRVDLEHFQAVHVPVLGGPVTDAATVEHLATNAGAARDRGWPAVLWTDVPREHFVAARSCSDADLASVREMADMARANGFVVVNVDEVFTAQAPMAEQEAFDAAMDDETDPHHDQAHGVLGAEIAARFGGAVLSPETVPRPAPPTPGRAELTEQVADVVITLVRRLRARGDLDFAVLDRFLRAHPRGDLVLEAAVAAIARRPAWRALVRTVTVAHSDRGLTEAAATWLDIGAEIPSDRGGRRTARFHDDPQFTAILRRRPRTPRDEAAEIAALLQARDPAAPKAARDLRSALDLNLTDGVLNLAVTATGTYPSAEVLWAAVVNAIAADPSTAVHTVVLPVALKDIQEHDPLNAALDLIEFTNVAPRPGHRYSARLAPPTEIVPQIPGVQAHVMFDFEPGTTRPDPASMARLDVLAEYLADAVLARHDRGMNLPQVVVASGAPTHRQTIGALLAVAVDRHLHAAQAGREPSERVGRVDVGMVITEALGRPQQVIVTVDGTKPATPAAAVALSGETMCSAADLASLYDLPSLCAARTTDPASQAGLMAAIIDDIAAELTTGGSQAAAAAARLSAEALEILATGVRTPAAAIAAVRDRLRIADLVGAHAIAREYEHPQN